MLCIRFTAFSIDLTENSELHPNYSLIYNHVFESHVVRKARLFQSFGTATEKAGSSLFHK